MAENKRLIAVRGGGDIATGVVYRLKKCGFDVVILETSKPTAIRRTVSLCMAVYEGVSEVEGIKAVLTTPENVAEYIDVVPVIVDENCSCLSILKPFAVVDATIAKRNTGMNINMAEVTVALGCGFTAGVDVHAVVETMRGHNLSRVIYEGSAMADTGVPGVIMGKSSERVIKAPCDGIIKIIKDIGSVVNEGEVIALCGDSEITAPFSGLVRGMIKDGFIANQGLKIADIDPRIDELKNCYTISDKALAVGGGVVEAVFTLMRLKDGNCCNS